MHFWVQIPRNCKVFPRRLTNGGGGELLTIGYCLRKISYFSLLFSGNFCGADKALMEGTKS